MASAAKATVAATGANASSEPLKLVSEGVLTRE